MNDEIFNEGGDAAEYYERLLGHRVIIYYRTSAATTASWWARSSR